MPQTQYCYYCWLLLFEISSYSLFADGFVGGKSLSFFFLSFGIQFFSVSLLSFYAQTPTNTHVRCVRLCPSRRNKSLVWSDKFSVHFTNSVFIFGIYSVEFSNTIPYAPPIHIKMISSCSIDLVLFLDVVLNVFIRDLSISHSARSTLFAENSLVAR